ncbi:MAG: hypothetical protein P1U53_12075, partial [Sulfitobacter sp.]|nr:hypothetical protein [Sulfitobacter sp.]
MIPIVEWNMGGFFFGEEYAGMTYDLSVADFNGDGIDDYIIGDRNGNDGEGQVIVVFGRERGEAPFFQVSDLEDDEYIILQSDNGLSGISQFGQFSRGIETGDFNGDGFDDIAISASRERNEQEEILGSVSFFYGRSKEDTDDLLMRLPGNVWDGANFDGMDGFKILGDAAGDSLGADLVNLGDRDGDGGDELGILSLNTGATSSQFVIIWSDNEALSPSQSLSNLPMDRVSILTNLPGMPTFVDTVPFEAVDSEPIRDLDNRLGDFINNFRHADIGFVFDNGSGEVPMVVEGSLLMRGYNLDYNDIPDGLSYRVPFHNPESYDVRGSVVTDINGDFTPELWWSFYDAEDGINIGLDWRYIPNVNGQGEVIDGFPFNPMSLPPFVQSFEPPESDGPFPFAGRNIESADIYGDYADFLALIYLKIFQALLVGDVVRADYLLNTLTLLFEEQGNLQDMVSALFFTSTDSHQGLGSPNVFQTLSAVDPQPEAALQVGGPTPIYYGGVIDVLRNANFSDNFTFDPTEWDGTNGYRIYGQDQFGGTGWEQAVGDVTGDGIEDLIFSVPFADVNGVMGAGAVMTLVGGEKNLRAQDAEDGDVDGIIYTSSLMQTAELRAGLILQTFELNTAFGNQLDGIGDINGDGIDDMVVSAEFAEVDGASFAGRSFVIFGQHNFNGDTLFVDQLTAEQGFEILGQNDSDALGREVAGIGDVNNDGRDDLLVTAPQADPLGRNFAGEAYVIYGRAAGMPFPTELDPTTLSSSEGYTIQGASAGDFMGGGATALGDVNNDSFADFAIFRGGTDPAYEDSYGSIHVIFGRDGNLSGPLDLDDLDGTNGFTIEGVEGFPFAGPIATTGDVNGDGINDIILASPFADNSFAPVIFGSADGFDALVVVDETTPGIMGNAQRFFGWDVAGGGDLNGDGRSDFVLVQAKFADDPAKAFLHFGAPDLLSGGNDVPADVTFNFRPEYSLEYGEVDFAGDVNGDGYDDLILATEAGEGLDGEVYLIFGRPDSAFASSYDLSALDGHDGYRIVGGGSALGYGRAAAGLGDIDGDGIADIGMGLPVDDQSKGGDPACVAIIFGGAHNLIALDLADGVRDGQIDFHNTTTAYTEFAQSLDGNGIWEGSFLDDVAGVGSFDDDGDQISQGDDTIEGREGDDFIFAGAGDDIVRGGQGADTLLGQQGMDTLEGGEGDDSLDGGEEADSLEGGLGHDLLEGGAGDDTLFGGQGDDTLTGGAGADHFRIELNGGQITITDFESGTDKLDMSDFSRLLSLDAYFDRTAGSTILSLPDQTTVTIQNLDPEDLLPGDLILEGENIPVSGSLVFDGILEENRVQSLGTQGLSDPEGVDPETILIEWLRDGTPIAGANGAEYTLTAEDIGSDISVRYSYTDFFGAAETITSDVKGPVAPDNAPPVGRPTIIGEIFEEDQILGVDTSTISDADGIDETSYMFQWLRDGVDIPGATGTAYQLTQDDVGAEISVATTYTDLKGNSASPTSLPTPEIANVDDPIQGVMSISGTPWVGEVLTSDATGITDADGIAELTYYWTRDGGFISGATENTYTVTEADEGARIFAGARVVDTFGEVSFRSGASVVINSNPTGMVEVTGQAVRDGTVTADISAVEDVDGIIEETISYQWRRDGVDIAGPGDEAATYVLTAEDVGRQITVQVTYVDETGKEEELVSAPVTPIVAGLLIEGGPFGDPLTGDGGND